MIIEYEGIDFEVIESEDYPNQQDCDILIKLGNEDISQLIIPRAYDYLVEEYYERSKIWSRD